MKFDLRKIICLKVVMSLISVSIAPSIQASSGPSEVSIEQLSREANEELIVENEELEERIDTFLSLCSEDADPVELPPTPEYSCSLEAEALGPIIEELEEQGRVEAASEALSSCAESPSVMPSSIIHNFKEDLTGELQCRKDDVEYYEQSCGEEFQCNLLRSGISASKVFPEIVQKPIRQFLVSKAIGASDTKHCLDESRSNCLTEVWTAFVANITDTMSSLWSLAKTGWNSLWNLSDFFDRKSDELHVAASQKKEDVVSFWRSPGEWVYKKFGDFKESVEDWMKESVFCQEWEGTPHMGDSKCVRPLETFGCVNCGDMTNAFCAAAGVIASELGLVIATAGAGTAVSIAAHMGVKAAGRAALKVSAKVASVAPKMSKLTKGTASAGKTSSLSTKAKVIAEATVEASRVVVRISSEKLAHTKELIGKYKDGLLNTRAAQVTLKAIDVASTPMIVLDKAAEMGIVASERLMSRVIPGSTGRYLRRRATVRQLATPETESTHRLRERLNFTLRHQARGARTVSTYEQRKPSNSSTNNARSGENFSEPREMGLHAQGAHQEGPSSNRRNADTKTTAASNENTSRAQERRQQRSAEQGSQGPQHSSEHPQASESKEQRSSERALGRKIVLADAALKASGVGNVSGADDMIAEAERLIEDHESGQLQSEAAITTREEALKALTGNSSESQSVTTQEAREKYQNLRQTYSQGNKRNFVRSMSQATGLDPSVAANYFDRRQKEIESAGNMLFPTEDESTRKKRNLISELSREVEGLDDEMDDLSESIDRDRLESALGARAVASSTSAAENDQDEVKRGDFDNTVAATPSPVATGVPAASSIASGASSPGRAPASTSPAALSEESARRAALESAGLIETIGSSEARILEGLINVDALRLIKGTPSELEALRENFASDLTEVTAHGKIRSSKGEFLFIQTPSRFHVFKKRNNLWVKIESSSLENLLRQKAIASR